jgi:hypothetical protein
MKMFLKYFLALQFFLIPVVLISAEMNVPTATLSGYVTDKANGETMPFVNVVILGTKIGGTSNLSGYYAIPNVPLGKQKIRYSFLGYREQIIELDVTEKKNYIHNIALYSNDMQVEEVIVTADRLEERKAVQTSRIVMQSQDLEQLPSIGETDVFRALQMLPGVKASSEFSSGLYVRGGGPDQNLILLDGTVVYNPSHLFGFFSTFNNDAVKDIELIKGGLPAEYGGRLSSVLNVTNKDGDRVNTRGKGSVSLISSRLTGEGPIGNGSWFLSGRRTYFDQFISLGKLDEGKDALPLYYFYDANGKFNQDVGENDKLSFVGYTGKDNLTFKEEATSSEAGLNWGNTTGSLKWTHIFDRTLFSNFIITGSKFRSEMTFGNFDSEFRALNELSDYSLKGDIDYFATNEHFIKLGFWFSTYRFNVLRTFGDNVYYDLTLYPSNYAMYAQDDWEVNERWHLQSGLRLEKTSERDEIKIGPRFSAKYNFTENMQCKAATGLYYQYLNLVTGGDISFFDMWSPLDKKMPPGKSIDYVLGIETQPDEGYDCNLEVYYKAQENLAEFKNEVTSTTELNELFFLGNGTSYGAEIFLQKKTGDITGFIGYTISWAKRQFTEINNGKEFYPKYDRRHDVTISGNYRLNDNWKLSSSFTYATGQSYTAAAGRYVLPTPQQDFDLIIPGERYNRRLAPYHRLDVSLTNSTTFFGLRGNWYIQIFNLYSHRNVWFKSFDTQQNPTEITDVKLLPIIPTVGIDFEL